MKSFQRQDRLCAHESTKVDFAGLAREFIPARFECELNFMAICSRCDKSGLFSSVDTNGLCKNCAKEFATKMAEAERSIDHTLFLIPKAVDPEEKLRRCKKLFDALNSLVEFEELNLPAHVAKRKKGEIAEVRKEVRSLAKLIGGLTVRPIGSRSLEAFLLNL